MTIYFGASIRGGRGDQAIYEEIIDRLLGVGCEIGRAVEWGQRVICLYRPSAGKRLSGMIAGCRNLTVHEYSHVDEVDRILKKALKA